MYCNKFEQLSTEEMHTINGGIDDGGGRGHIPVKTGWPVKFGIPDDDTWVQ